MRGLARIRRTWFVLPMVCALALDGCSADFAVSFCASEQQSMSIGGLSTSTSTRSAVSIGVGDSVRLAAHGFCRGPGLHVAIGTAGTRWRSDDASIVRLSPAADSSARDAGTMATVWAVGVAPGRTVGSGALGETAGSLRVDVVGR